MFDNKMTLIAWELPENVSLVKIDIGKHPVCNFCCSNNPIVKVIEILSPSFNRMVGPGNVPFKKQVSTKECATPVTSLYTIMRATLRVSQLKDVKLGNVRVGPVVFYFRAIWGGGQTTVWECIREDRKERIMHGIGSILCLMQLMLHPVSMMCWTNQIIFWGNWTRTKTWKILGLEQWQCQSRYCQSYCCCRLNI